MEMANRQEAVHGRSVRHRRQVGLGKTVDRDIRAGQTHASSREIPDRIEWRPQQGRADRTEVVAKAGRGPQFEECFMKSVRTGDAAVIEVLILVLERQVLVKPQRTKVGEVLDLVGGVKSRGPRRVATAKKTRTSGRPSPTRPVSAASISKSRRRRGICIATERVALYQIRSTPHRPRGSGAGC